MQLPIDIRQGFRDKYFLETPLFADWFEFGQKEETADISYSDGDVFINVPMDKVQPLLALRAKFLSDLIALLKPESTSCQP
jgi:hypothetical protein